MEHNIEQDRLLELQEMKLYDIDENQVFSQEQFSLLRKRAKHNSTLVMVECWKEFFIWFEYYLRKKHKPGLPLIGNTQRLLYQVHQHLYELYKFKKKDAYEKIELLLKTIQFNIHVLYQSKNIELKKMILIETHLIFFMKKTSSFYKKTFQFDLS